MTQLSIMFVIFALISFFVDAATGYLSDAQCTQILLCLYLYLLTYIPSYALLIIVGSMLSVQDLIFFGHTGIQLIYLLPLSLAHHGLTYIMYPSSIQLILTAIVAGLSQIYLIRSAVLGQCVDASYTVHTICGIVIGVMVISLIYWLRGMLGNRMRTL